MMRFSDPGAFRMLLQPTFARTVASTAFATLATVAALCGAAGPVRGQDAAPGAAAEEGDDAPFRIERPYLGDPDPGMPSQAQWDGWPGEELRQRPYWLPWSTATFQRASLFRRPVLFVLDAPWSRAAQRMRREVLTHPRVLEIANRDYLTILVNADRRPDLRERYQTGSWPVLHFLLPNSHPMLSRLNEPEERRPITAGAVDVEGMLFLLEEGTKYWEKYAPELMVVGETWSRREETADPESGPVEPQASDALARWLLGSADRRNGGFGAAPKFLRPSFLEYARARAERGEDDLAAHARFTLEKLVASPLYDAEEGGVHRLATRADWGGIQYEKLLAGNAAFLRELELALRVEEDPALRRALQATARYVAETLAHPQGGFHLAQIADPRSDDGGDYWRAPRRDPAQAPPLDPLVLSGPTAQAGAALLRAGALLDDPGIAEAGRAALDHVLDEVWRPGRGVGHELHPTRSARVFLTTQVEVAFALLEGYDATGDPRLLDAADDIATFCLRNLRGGRRAMLVDVLPSPAPLGLLANPRRPIPANARLARVLIRLHHLDRAPDGLDAARAILGEMSGNLPAFGPFGIEPALAVEEATRAPVVELRGPAGPEREALRRASLESPLSWTLVRAGATEGPLHADVTVAGTTRRYADPAALAQILREIAAGGPRP